MAIPDPIGIKDGAGGDVTVNAPLDPGRAAAAESRPVVLSTEDKSVLDAVATQTTLAAVLAKLSADPATQTTLAALLAKVIAAPATEAKQDAIIAKLIAAPATETSAAAAVTSLAVIDDWDESDRAKVNPIVGQAGVAAGAGAVGVTVQRFTLASDDPAVATLGAVADAAVTAGATGTLSAKLRSISRDLAALIAQIPATLGIKTAANSLSVAPASDGVFAVARAAATTGTQTSVASGTGDVTILASNANRRGATVFNDDANVLYLLLSSGTSSATNYSVQVGSLDYYEVPAGYTGVIKGLWAADGSGSARVTEFTA